MSNFTGVLEDIEAVIGSENTFKIAHEFGGSCIFIPKKPREKSELVKLIGMENVEKLARDFGAGEVLIPMGHFRGSGAKRVRIAKMIEQGLSNNTISRRMDIHKRTVQRMKKKNYNNLPLLDWINENTPTKGKEENETT